MHDHFFFKAFCVISTLIAFSNSNRAVFQRQQIINKLDERTKPPHKGP